MLKPSFQSRSRNAFQDCCLKRTTKRRLPNGIEKENAADFLKTSFTGMRSEQALWLDPTEISRPADRRRGQSRRQSASTAWVVMVMQPISGGISNRPNEYLRTQLIHGARAALPHLAAKPNRLGEWLQSMLARSHTNFVVVALAANFARIAWAALRHEEKFNHQDRVTGTQWRHSGYTLTAHTD